MHIRARLPVSQVVSRKVSLKRQGREYAGLSPFKAEKTPSFFVNDQKGFYHCFASGEHGDIFTFVVRRRACRSPRRSSDWGCRSWCCQFPKSATRTAQRRTSGFGSWPSWRRQRASSRRSCAGAAAVPRPGAISSGAACPGRTVTRFRLGYAPAGRAFPRTATGRPPPRPTTRARRASR